MKYTCVIFIFITFSLSALAQIDTGEVPYSFTHNTNAEVEQINMQKISWDEIQKIKKRNLQSAKKSLIFAHVFECDIPFFEHATKTVFDNGVKLYQLKIVSEGAFSLNFTLSNFYLPDNVKLFVYSADYKDIKGAFTYQNNKKNNLFAIEPVRGSAAIFECYVPPENKYMPRFKISRIGHDFVDVLKITKGISGVYGESGDCNIDLNCPEGVEWQLEKNSVCKIIVNNQELCSGAFINNTNYDGRPYFLTANHCINTYYKANNTIFYFNYESIACDGPAGTGSNTVSGAELKATNSYVDFSLVEVTTQIPESYGLFLSGWNRKNTPPTASYCIHHPNGDVKKLAIDRNEPETGNYGEGLRPNSHWKVLEWEMGTTEKGSSGAPQFDENHFIIGELTGGEANCSNPVNDYFSKMYHLWDESSETNKQLKYWLDPAKTGAEVLPGFDPNEPQHDIDVQLYSIISPNGDYCNEKTFAPEIVLRNKGRNTLETVNVRYQLDFNEQSAPYEWSGSLLTNISDKIVLPEFEVNSGVHTFKIWIEEPNGTNDSNNKNDTLSIIFSNKQGADVELQLTTDDFGAETTWEISGKSGIISQGGIYESNVQINNSFCLESGCYKFKIFDTNSDGICCKYGKGIFRLINHTDADTLKVGSDFADADSVHFCIANAVVDKDVEKQIKRFKVYPNPGHDIFTVVAIDTSLELTNLVDKQIEVSVLDITGRMIRQYRFINQEMKLNLAALPESLYVIRVFVDNMYFSDKIVIRR